MSEAEERGSGDEASPVPGGSTDDLESEGIITFTARKPSSKWRSLLFPRLIMHRALQDLKRGIVKSNFVERELNNRLNFIGKAEDMDPVLFTYQSAIAQLMHNQQIALAGFLAASAMAHLPVQPELTPLQTPQLPRAKGKLKAPASPKVPSSPRQLAVKNRKAGHCRGQAATGVPSSVVEQARIHQQRLRFVLERHRESLKRVMSIGKSL